jgi:prepilin-type N-terminal cleavage/methylation domain-containing protein
MSKGFTIIELVISILIMAIAIVGIFNAFTALTIMTSDTANRLTATYLAQEGMEVIRNIRDINWIERYNDPAAGPDWIYGLDSCSSGCQLDYTTVGTTIIPWGIGNYLFLDDSTGFYTIDDTNEVQTKFKRKFIVEQEMDPYGDDSYIIKTTVQVSWDQKATLLNPARSAGDCNSSNCITVVSTLYNWFLYE